MFFVLGQMDVDYLFLSFNFKGGTQSAVGDRVNESRENYCGQVGNEYPFMS